MKNRKFSTLIVMSLYSLSAVASQESDLTKQSAEIETSVVTEASNIDQIVQEDEIIELAENKQDFSKLIMLGSLVRAGYNSIVNTPEKFKTLVPEKLKSGINSSFTSFKDYMYNAADATKNKWSNLSEQDQNKYIGGAVVGAVGLTALYMACKKGKNLYRSYNAFQVKKKELARIDGLLGAKTYSSIDSICKKLVDNGLEVIFPPNASDKLITKNTKLNCAFVLELDTRITLSKNYRITLL